MDEKKINADIEQYGWTIMALEASDYLPSLAYTIGLWKNYQHPELIIFGLPVTMMHAALNEAGAMIKTGEKIETNKPYDDFFENGIVECLQVDERNIPDYFGIAIDFYQSKAFPALQLVWTDRKEKFPWQDGFETEFLHKQPLLDRNVEFKFFEEKKLEVYVSAQFLEGQTIVQVIHQPDGDWYFMTEDENQAALKMIGLEQVIVKDPSINDLFDLDYGQEAVRSNVNEKWERRLIS